MAFYNMKKILKECKVVVFFKKSTYDSNVNVYRMTSIVNTICIENGLDRKVFFELLHDSTHLVSRDYHHCS